MGSANFYFIPLIDKYANVLGQSAKHYSANFPGVLVR